MIGTPAPDIHRVRTLGAEWERALDALAGVEGADGTPLASLVAPRGVLATVAELVVVTARPEHVADALVARAAGGQIPALVPWTHRRTQAARRPPRHHAVASRGRGRPARRPPARGAA